MGSSSKKLKPIEEYSSLVDRFVTYIDKSYGLNLSQDEIKSALNDRLLKCHKNFDPEKGATFETYFWSCAGKSCLNENEKLNRWAWKQKRKKKSERKDSYIGVDEVEAEDTIDYLFKMAKLTKAEKKLVIAVYLGGATINELCYINGVWHPLRSNIKKMLGKAVKKIKNVFPFFCERTGFRWEEM